MTGHSEVEFSPGFTVSRCLQESPLADSKTPYLRRSANTDLSPPGLLSGKRPLRGGVMTGEAITGGNDANRGGRHWRGAAAGAGQFSRSRPAAPQAGVTVGTV